MLDIQSLRQGDVTIITLKGRVDGSNAPQLEVALQNALVAKQYKIVVDLSETSFVSSAGMRALLKARSETQDKRSELRLAALTPFILDSFKLVGLDKLFKLYDSRQAALADF